MPRDECLRLRLWKISMYSKIALASSTRVFQRLRSRSSTCIRLQNDSIPVVHETTYEELRKVSPLLASRNGLATATDSMAVIVTKIAELVAVEDELIAQ